MNLYTQNIDDTICAIATPFGIGGIAVIRVSGDNAFNIVDCIFTPYKETDNWHKNERKAVLGKIIDENKDFIDEVICTPFHSPKSFTGENIVEISCHGSSFIQQEILRLLINNGCRMATNGEFSKRAFFNNKLDLSQAESIADLIASESKSQHLMAINQLKGNYSNELDNLREQMLTFATLIELELDFAEEDVEFANRESLNNLLNDIEKRLTILTDSFKNGNSIKKGIPTAIIGSTNVGKSTILNRIIGEEKAIVSNIPGTTRDIIEDIINIDGILYRFIDTAGLRNTNDEIESLGIKKSLETINKADLILIVIDIDFIKNEELLNDYVNIIEKSTDRKKIIIVNKIDKISNYDDIEIEKVISKLSPNEKIPFIGLSAQNDETIEPLKKLINKTYKDNINCNNDIVVSNIRHYDLLRNALNSIKSIKLALSENISPELLAQDMRICIEYIGEITGKSISSENILHNIFKNFCIGK